MHLLRPGTRVRQMAVRGRALAGVETDFAAALTSGGKATWTWFNQPEAVYDAGNDRTLVGGVSSVGGIWVHYYDHATGRVRSVALNSNFGEIDDHDNPSIVKLAAGGPSAGCYSFGYAGHSGGPANVGKTGLLAGSVSGLSAAKTVGNATRAYSVRLQAADTAKTLYTFYRGPGTPWGRMFKTSTDGGLTWGSEIDWLEHAVNTNRPYPQYCLSDDGLRIDVVYTTGHPTTLVCSLYHVYVTIAADGTRNWYKGDGTLLSTGDASLPITHSSGLLVYDGTTTNSWVWDLCNVEGVLTLAYTHRGTGGTVTDWQTSHNYRIARFVAGSWVSEDVCDGGGTGADGLYAAEAAYSGGICLDPLDRDAVFVSRKYGAADFRIEKWTRDQGSGVWSKAATLSPSTPLVYARPRRVRNSSPTRIVFWGGTYTSYNSFSTDVYHWPALPITTPSVRVKPASPAWQAGSAPGGVNGYWPLTEGSGTTATDYYTSPHNGTFVGAPAWATGTLGPQLGSFSTTKYVAVNPASQLVATGSYPFWIAACFTNTSTAAEGYLLSCGNSADADTIIALTINASAGAVRGFLRNDTGGGPQTALNATGQTQINDGNPHALMVVSWGDADHALYLDGVEVARNTTALGTVTLNRMALGCLLRSSAASPHLGSLIAAACGSGGVPDPLHFAEDWLYGDFLAVRP